MSSYTVKELFNRKALVNASVFGAASLATSIAVFAVAGVPLIGAPVITGLIAIGYYAGLCEGVSEAAHTEPDVDRSDSIDGQQPRAGLH